MFAQDANAQGRKQGGRRPLAGNIAHCDGQAPLSVGQKIIKVAAQFLCREIEHGDINSMQPGHLLWQKQLLDLARPLQVFRPALLGPAQLIVQAGILEGDSHGGGQGGEHLFVIFGECARLDALEIQDAEQAVFHDQRNDQLRLHQRAPLAPDVPWVELHPVYADRLPFEGSGARRVPHPGPT